jgi:hypothetical protein
MPRNPNDPNSRSSGEWSPFVTLEAFGNFLIEFRDKYGHIDKKLDEITSRIAKGDGKFDMLQRDAAECKLKQDSHSTLIRALSTKEAIREATDAKPPSYFMATILPIVLSVLIPASMLLVYKLVILDAKTEDKKAEDKTETHPAHHVP